MPDDLNIDDILGYFQTTWIEGLSTGRRAPGNAKFLPPTWNCFDRTLAQLNRTNNPPSLFTHPYPRRLVCTVNLDLGPGSLLYIYITLRICYNHLQSYMNKNKAKNSMSQNCLICLNLILSLFYKCRQDNFGH